MATILCGKFGHNNSDKGRNIYSMDGLVNAKEDEFRVAYGGIRLSGSGTPHLSRRIDK